MTAEPTISVERLVALCDRIRDYVNEPRVHASLFADNTRFRQACSAMDMIGDTAQALRSYAQLSRSDADLGTAYLVVFGAIQVLYVQQDAVFFGSARAWGSLERSPQSRRRTNGFTRPATSNSPTFVVCGTAALDTRSTAIRGRPRIADRILLSRCL